MFEKYALSHLNADKRHSILPTVLELVSPSREIVDVGCGDGFFTIPLVKKAEHVYGIDDSREQLTKAKAHPKVTYMLQDMFDRLPPCDGICAPFVLNYARNVDELVRLLSNFYQSLREGRMVGVVDLPSPSIDPEKKKKYLPVIKTVKELRDESKIQLDFYPQNELAFSLESFYYTPETLTASLYKVGFSGVRWHKPLIEAPLGDWYYDFCELGYVTAEKSLD